MRHRCGVQRETDAFECGPFFGVARQNQRAVGGRNREHDGVARIGNCSGADDGIAIRKFGVAGQREHVRDQGRVGGLIGEQRSNRLVQHWRDGLTRASRIVRTEEEAAQRLPADYTVAVLGNQHREFCVAVIKINFHRR